MDFTIKIVGRLYYNGFSMPPAVGLVVASKCGKCPMSDVRFAVSAVFTAYSGDSTLLT